VFYYPSAANLTAPENIDGGKVRDIAKSVAKYFGLPEMEFACAPHDANIFDFSGTTRAKSSCAFLEAPDAQGEHGSAMVLLIGDALMEPFWPEGLGIVRGFLSALDAAAAIEAWDGKNATEARRVSAKALQSLKALNGKTASTVLQADFQKYAVRLSTRYR